MIDGTLGILWNQLEDQRKLKIENLADGSAKDFAQYQNTVGTVRGLLIAQSLIQDLAKNMEMDDE
jgi:hypothetical protein